MDPTRALAALATPTFSNSVNFFIQERAVNATGNTTLIPTGPLPEPQAHCTSPIYCPGPLLQAVQLSAIYSDSKTFVDSPTLKPEQDVVNAFNALGSGNGEGITYGELTTFLAENFGESGTELVDADLGDQFHDSPAFLDKVTDPVLHSWLKTVHSYWPLLARTTNESDSTGKQCDGCASSFIPFKERRTIVIPGDRFIELYYWDTYFVILGLLESELHDVVKGLLENFADLIEMFGFILNGNRVYYENRSQPPLFIQMVDAYVNRTGDTDVLHRLLPLMDKEHDYWINNRTMELKSPYSGKKLHLAHYRVDTSAPRPESYLADYQTVELAKKEQQLDLKPAEKAKLYSNIASGAESGHDFAAVRWSKRPTLNTTNNIPAQRFLNTAAQIPVDLNAILYKNEKVLAKYHNMTIKTSNGTIEADPKAAKHWHETAHRRKEAILDLFWDKELLWFYDFNMTAGHRSPDWTAAGVWPYWAGIIPPEFLSKKGDSAPSLQKSFAGLRYLVERYNGTLSTTLKTTGQQWDFPNAWAPHTRVAIEALRSLPHSLTKGEPLEPAPKGSFALIPRKSGKSGSTARCEDEKETDDAKKDDDAPATQLGQKASELPVQYKVHPSKEAVYTDLSKIGVTSASDGTKAVEPLLNVGKEGDTSESWSDALARRIANRYITSALCSWHTTGGDLQLPEGTPGADVWKRVSDETLEKQGFPTNTSGLMFEKFSATSPSQSGTGGEYPPQAGFG